MSMAPLQARDAELLHWPPPNRAMELLTSGKSSFKLDAEILSGVHCLGTSKLDARYSCTEWCRLGIAQRTSPAMMPSSLQQRLIRIRMHIYQIQHTYRFRAKREYLQRSAGLLPESQGQNLTFTELYVPCSLDSGTAKGGGQTLSHRKC